MARLGTLVRSMDSRLVFVLLGILFALPLGWGAFTGITLWISPFMMLNSAFTLKTLVWLHALAFPVLVMAGIHNRWFCRRICPMGWACDQVSSHRRGRGPSLIKVPPLGKWLAISSLLAALVGIPLFVWLDPMSIFNSFFTVFSADLTIPILLSFMGLPLILAVHLIFPDLWCSKLCPLGGLQDEMTTLRKMATGRPASTRDKKRRVSVGRRLFLASGGGLLAGFLIPAFLKQATYTYLQPPGAQAPERFNTLCLRCGSCIKACPTNILHHHTDSGDLLSWMVPEISFSDGYCLEECNLCSRVCPSGAISLFTTDAKSNLVIGIARVHAQKCLLAENKECDRCKAVCSYDAIRIEAKEAFLQGQVVIDRDKCTGCGACAVICPPRVIEILPLEALS